MRARKLISQMDQKSWWFLLLGCLLLGPTPGWTGETIDLLVLYTPGATSLYNGSPETRVNHLFNVANQVYKDSGVDLTIRPVHMVEVEYPDSTDSIQALYDVTFRTDEAFQNVEQLRQEYGADMVILYRPYASGHGSCGVAWLGGYQTEGDFTSPWMKSYMFSHVSMSTCGDYVTAHELGHNMGLNHSRLQDGSGGTFDWALGYGEYNKFVTIMAYQTAFNVDYWAGKIYKFSSPDLDCNGSPCGIDKDDSVNGADAVSTLKVTTPQIASFFPSLVDDASGDDESLSALEQQIKELEALYQQLLEAYRGVLSEKNAAREAYLNALRVLRGKLATYRRTRTAYLRAARVYQQSIRRYRLAQDTGNRSALRRAAQAARTSRKAYISRRTDWRVAQRAYVTYSRQEVRVAKAAYLAANKQVIALRQELLQTQQALADAKSQLV